MQLAASKGLSATKQGWPDFLCIGSDGEAIAVEVKPRVSDGSRMKRVKESQAVCMDFLTSKGVKCYVSDGVALEPYDRSTHRGKAKGAS